MSDIEPPQPTASAVIVAAGSGKRFGDPHKSFVDLCGRPLVSWSLDAFQSAPSIGEIVLVVGDHTADAGSALLQSNEWPKLRLVVRGGERRQDSVTNGLAATNPESDVLVIHDGARPLVTIDLIEAIVSAAAESGACLAAVPVTDTLKEVGPDDLVVRTIPRESVWAAQTPQGFQRRILLEAVDEMRTSDLTFTDEAGLLESLGRAVAIVPSDPANIKVTTPSDLQLAEFLLTIRRERRHE